MFLWISFPCGCSINKEESYVNLWNQHGIASTRSTFQEVFKIVTKRKRLSRALTYSTSFFLLSSLIFFFLFHTFIFWEFGILLFFFSFLFPILCYVLFLINSFLFLSYAFPFLILYLLLFSSFNLKWKKEIQKITQTLLPSWY